MPKFQTYKWDLADSDECLTIYASGVDENKLDKSIFWTKGKIDHVLLYLKQTFPNHRPVSYEIVKMPKIYYSEESTFLKLFFRNLQSMKAYTFKSGVNILGVGNNLKFTVHESHKEVLVQFFSVTGVSPCGWVEVDSETDWEVVDYSYKSLKPVENDKISNPIILSYDIECVSHDKSGNTFPKATLPNDIVICICAKSGKSTDPPEKWRKWTLVNASKSHSVDGALNYPSEKELLLGWLDVIRKVNPNVILSYNGLMFDDIYIYERLMRHSSSTDFCMKSGVVKEYSPIRENKWNSSAYGEQFFRFVNMFGRLHIDMYPVIFKDFTRLMSYKLDSVAEEFLTLRKIDLPANEMMKMYYNQPEKMATITEYCDWDSELPFRLFQCKKLMTWINITETSNIMNVPIIDLITRGQQIRVYSQIYKKAYSLGFVCNAKYSDYHPTDEDEKFVGAVVQTPVPGFWKNAPTYDFNSLYPNSIITNNYCMSTYIPPGSLPDDASLYNCYEWDDHKGCPHDKTVRKTKIKQEDVICKHHKYHFYKSSVKKGVVPRCLEELIAARKVAKKKMEEYKGTDLETLYDKRQNAYKVSANSFYGGYGSGYSFLPFFEGAACTTYYGRESISKVIDYVKKKFGDDVKVLYGDTDSCMLWFNSCKDDCKKAFEVARALEKELNTLFPPPMKIELEKIYGKYFLFGKKKYVGWQIDENGVVKKKDVKGVVAARRDGTAYQRLVFNYMVDNIMNEVPKYVIWNQLYVFVKNLLEGSVQLEDLIIVKTLKDEYKSKQPHKEVADKMISRGKYVTSNTRIRYVLLDTGNSKDPQYKRSEDPDYLQDHPELKIDYKYYFEKQLINCIDELFEVRYGTPDVLNNLFKLMKAGVITDVKKYFMPCFKVSKN